LLSKQYEVFVCSRAAGIYSCTCWSVKENALCEWCGTCCCFVHYFNSKFETLFFCYGWVCS